MKKRTGYIFVFTVALVLFTGLAFAARKKEGPKITDQIQALTHEEEALQVELLEATGEQMVKEIANNDDSSRRPVLTGAKERIRDESGLELDAD